MTITSKRGFTLIELLVVIAIIGILSSVVLASLNTAREKSRDAARASDIRQIQLALEFFFDENRSYPTSTDSTAIDALVTAGHLPDRPEPPAGGAVTAYNYQPGTISGGLTTSYCLGVDMEDTAAVPGNDTDCQAAASGTNYTTAGNEYYSVEP